jgi:phosphoglycolate phosphatase (TIGR01487 family)
MRYLALATDYDGTLAHKGVVSPDAIRALEELRRSGRKVILVTGREMPELEAIFPRLDLFERIVAENGALLYNPSSKESRTLADPPPASFAEDLRHRGVPNVSTGAVIVAITRPYEREAIDAIQAMGLELQVIFNKDAVMILPSGVNKMTGLKAALKEMKISPHEVVAVGDAENDHAFLGRCEVSVAVANAIPSLKEKADLVTPSPHGEGVQELIAKLLQNDLIDLAPRLLRHHIPLGKAGAREIALDPVRTAALVCGESTDSKSTLIATLLERLAGKGRQVCLIDPEGHYEDANRFVTTGNSSHAPSLDHLDKLLGDPAAQVAVNLAGVPLSDRPGWFDRVLAIVQSHRLSTARPHWLIVDQAHQMFPNQCDLTSDLGSFVLVTGSPTQVPAQALKKVNTVIAAGTQPAASIAQFCKLTEKPPAPAPDGNLAPGEALVYCPNSSETVTIKL